MPATAKLLPGRRLQRNAQRVIEVIETYYVASTKGAAVFDPTSITGMPAAGSSHSVFSDCVCNMYIPTEDPGSGGTRWTVDVVFSYFGTNPGGDPSATVVVKRRAWRTILGSQEFICDMATGIPPLDAAGMPFERVPQVPVGDGELILVRLEKSTRLGSLGDVAGVFAYRGTVNQAEITINGYALAIEEGLLDISVVETYNAFFPYEATYTIRLRRRLVLIGGNIVNVGWAEPLVERGFYARPAAGQPAVRILEDATTEVGTIKQPVAEPRLLASDGTLLPDGNDPVVTLFHPIQQADWNDLDLSDTYGTTTTTTAP
jgi:hypothetical protein